MRRLSAAAAVALPVLGWAGAAQAEAARVPEARQNLDYDGYQKVIELAGSHRKQDVGATFLALAQA